MACAMGMIDWDKAKMQQRAFVEDDTRPQSCIDDVITGDTALIIARPDQSILCM